MANNNTSMKLWTLAEISGEIAAASASSSLSSAARGNLININSKTTLCHLPYLFPFTDTTGTPFNSLGGYEGLAAIALACQHLNTGDGSIVPIVAETLANKKCGLKFNLAAFDTALQESVGVDQIIRITDRSNLVHDGSEAGEDFMLRPPCVILGAARSAVTMPTAIISGLRGFPQISPISTSPALDDKSQYKLFARTIPNDDGTSIPLIARLNSGVSGSSGGEDESQPWGVDYLAVVYIDDSYGSGFAQGIILTAQQMAPEMTILTFSIGINADDAAIQRVISSMAESELMYFFGILYPDALVDKVMTAAVEAGIAGDGKHNWLFSDSVGSGVIGRNFTVGSALERAYRGTGVLSAKGGVTGMKAYDALTAGLRELRESPEDMKYLYSLLPKYNALGQVTNHSDITDSASYLMSPGMVAPFLYDAVISLGLSACNLEMNFNLNVSNGNSSFALIGQNHYNAIVNTTFEGSSGTIILSNKTGTREPKSALFSLVNFVDDPDASSSTVVQFKSQETDVFKFGAWRSLQPYIFNSGLPTAPSDLPETDVERNYIPTGLRVLGLVLCGVIVILSVGFAAWTKKKEKIRVVKSAQPIFLYIIVMGALLMGFSIIPMSLDQGIVSTEGASAACISIPWLLACGFAMTFSALFTKTHRILTIMRNAAAFKRVKVTALDVAKPMIALLMTNVIILAVWTGIDPLSSETVVLQTNRFDQPTVTKNVCTSDHQSIFLAVLGVINLGALFIAFVEAYLARNISVELSESAYIMKAISMILLVSFIGIPVIIITQENTLAFYFVTVGIIFVVCVSILCLIFIPKIHASMKKAQRRTSSGRITGVSSQSEGDNEGVKILSSPKALAELEEENRNLKQAIAQNQGGNRRLSQISNSSVVGSVVGSDVGQTGEDMERENVVKFDDARNGDEENRKEMKSADADDRQTSSFTSKTVRSILTGVIPEEWVDNPDASL